METRMDIIGGSDGRRRLAPVLRGAMLVALSATLASCGIFKGGGGPKTPVVGNRTPILNTEKGVAVDPELADVAVTLPEPQANADWSQPGGNPSKAMGHVAYSGGFTRAWTANIAGSSVKARLASSPVVANGRLYVIDTEAQIHAFDAATGARVWTHDFSAEGNAHALFGGGVSIVGDRLFAANGVGDVAALEAATGKELWRVRPGGPLRGSPTAAFGQVYVISQDNQIFALNQDDGKLAWTESGTLQTTGVFGVAAPAAGQGTVIAGYSSGELSAYRYENGRSIWGDALSRTSISTAVASLTDIDADPVIDRGRVFAIGQGGRMASYELTSGQRVWEINIAGIATPWVAGEWVFVVTDDAKLLCIARGTGRIRWISQLRRFKVDKEKVKKNPLKWSGPVLAGGHLIVVSSLGDLTAVDPATGNITREEDLGDPINLPPIVAGNMLYVLQSNGRLVAMR